MVFKKHFFLLHFFFRFWQCLVSGAGREALCISCSALSELLEHVILFPKVSNLLYFWLWRKTFGDFYSDYIDNAEKSQQIITFLLALVRSRHVLLYLFRIFWKKWCFKTRIPKYLCNLQVFKVILVLYLFFIHIFKMWQFFNNSVAIEVFCASKKTTTYFSLLFLAAAGKL